MHISNYNVLFLCVGNAVRSIIAEAILNREGAGRFHAFSAGSQPQDAVDPQALNLLRKLNHPVAGLYPKSWEAFSGTTAPEMDFIFAVCDETLGAPCPPWPGQPLTARWGIPDPAAQSEAEKAAIMADAYRMLSNRILAFINLPMHSLDRLALRQRLEAIGKMPLL